MTDEMRAREKAICEAANVKEIGDVSDGFHTFNGLYEQRMILFAALVKAYKDKAWKSYRHEDGEYCFGGGWFIVGIDTPEGSYTYHYENKYWDMFDCVELENGKHWDGHTEADAETRLMSLKPAQPERIKGRWISADTIFGGVPFYCSECGENTRDTVMGKPRWNFCPNCGADMRGDNMNHLFSFIPSISETREIFGIERSDNMCEYDEAFTRAEMLEETGFCKNCKFDCPNRGKSEVTT